MKMAEINEMTNVFSVHKSTIQHFAQNIISSSGIFLSQGMVIYSPN